MVICFVKNHEKTLQHNEAYLFYEKCGLTCRKFQVSHAQRNH